MPFDLSSASFRKASIISQNRSQGCHTRLCLSRNAGCARRLSNVCIQTVFMNRAWVKDRLNVIRKAWWRHQMETFSALLATCAGNSPVPGEFPTQRPVTRSFDVYFDLRPNKQLSKQWRGWWFETPSWSLWRHRNGSPSPVCLDRISGVTWTRTNLLFHFSLWSGQDAQYDVSFTHFLVIMHVIFSIQQAQSIHVLRRCLHYLCGAI